MKPLLSLMICSVVTQLMSCNPSSSSVASEQTVEGDVLPEVEWDWSSFQRSSELVIGTMPLDIQPKLSLSIDSEASGIMTFEVPDKITQVTEDQVISRMDVETLAEQGERLTIQKERQILEDMKRDNLETPERRKQAKEELEEARRKVKLVEMILENPAMEEMSQDLFGSDMGRINENALSDARASLRIAEQKVAWAEEFDDKLLDGAQRIQEMDFTKSQRQYQQAKDRSVYTAPFTGELRLDVNYVVGQSEYTVASRETFATLSDFSEINAHLSVSNAAWINLQPQRLHISLNDEARTLLTFTEDRVEKDQRTQREERKYVFSVPLENNESLKRLTGTQMSGDLVYKLPAECYIVPKYDLALFALGKTETTDWAVMVKKLWPAATLLAQGQKNLAISYPQAL